MTPDHPHPTTTQKNAKKNPQKAPYIAKKDGLSENQPKKAQKWQKNQFPSTDRAEILNLDSHEVHRSESKSWQMALSEALTSGSGEGCSAYLKIFATFPR